MFFYFNTKTRSHIFLHVKIWNIGYITILLESPGLVVYTSLKQRESKKYKDAILVSLLGAMEAVYVVNVIPFYFIPFNYKPVNIS